MIVDALVQALRWLGAVLCNWIYELIALFYQLFMTVSRLNILSSDEIGPIYQRVTMILTIVMVFYITFEFVKYVIQPDTMTDKDKGATNIVKRMIIVVILIAFVPTIFSYAYKAQNRIIENQVFSKIILGKTNSDFSTFGNSFSANMLSLFYGVDGEVCANTNCSQAENFVSSNLSSLRTTGVSRIQKGINETVKVTIDGETENAPMIKFDGLMAIIVGGFIVYILVMYSIDVGTRYAQLLFLQIMSPVAIISYISPKKDGMFSKWTKQCITTYLDLFIRLAIIYFVLLIIDILGTSFMESDRLFAGISGVTPAIKTFSYIALVMGLLVFAQKAPKMLSELLPSGGAAGIGYGLGTKGRYFDRLAGAAIGTAAGAGAGLATGLGQGFRRRAALGANGKPKGIPSGIFGAAKGAIGGTIGGATRGLINGGKKGNVLKNGLVGAKKQVEANKKFGNREESGYSFVNQIGDRARGALGAKSRIEKLEEEKKPIKEQMDVYDKIFQSNKAQRDEAKKHVLEEGKGKYSGEYKAATQRARDLREDEATRNEFKVGKYKDKDAADQAYIETVRNARASVNASNFRDDNGVLNRDAYEREMNRVANQIDVKSFYNEISKYQTQADAEQAYKDALAAADRAVDDAEKKAINDYIDNGEWDATTQSYGDKDAKIMQMRRELEATVMAHNKNASDDRKVNNIELNANGQIEIDGNVVNAKDFHTFAKAQAELKSQRAAEVIEKDAEIEKIKRETSGSGIGESKK